MRLICGESNIFKGSTYIHKLYRVTGACNLLIRLRPTSLESRCPGHLTGWGGNDNDGGSHKRTGSTYAKGTAERRPEAVRGGRGRELKGPRLGECSSRTTCCWMSTRWTLPRALSAEGSHRVIEPSLRLRAAVASWAPVHERSDEHWIGTRGASYVGVMDSRASRTTRDR
jgi:hypothetical protein